MSSFLLSSISVIEDLPSVELASFTGKTVHINMVLQRNVRLHFEICLCIATLSDNYNLESISMDNRICCLFVFFDCFQYKDVPGLYN